MLDVFLIDISEMRAEWWDATQGEVIALRIDQLPVASRPLGLRYRLEQHDVSLTTDEDLAPREPKCFGKTDSLRSTVLE